MQQEPHTLGKSAGNRGKGRIKGVPNKITSDLKRPILEAAEAAGGPQGTVGYLTVQATANPAAFMSLLGKILPIQQELAGKDGAAFRVIIQGDDANL